MPTCCVSRCIYLLSWMSLCWMLWHLWNDIWNGATTFSIMTFSLTINTSRHTACWHCVVMLRVIYAEFRKSALYAQCLYAERCYAECCGTHFKDPLMTECLTVLTLIFSQFQIWDFKIKLFFQVIKSEWMFYNSSFTVMVNMVRSYLRPAWLTH